MKVAARLLIALVTLIGLKANAEIRKTGVGFVLGEPTALSAKFFLPYDRGIDVQLSINSRDYFLIYGDYLFHFPGLFGRQNEFLDKLYPYAGVGPLLAFGNSSYHAEGQYFDNHDDRFALGARVPFGAEWLWDKAPLGIGLELAPGVMIAPSTVGFLQGGISFRFYF